MIKAETVLTTHVPGPGETGIDEFGTGGLGFDDFWGGVGGSFSEKKLLKNEDMVQTDGPSLRPSRECGGQRMVEDAS